MDGFHPSLGQVAKSHWSLGQVAKSHCQGACELRVPCGSNRPQPPAGHESQHFRAEPTPHLQESCLLSRHWPEVQGVAV